MGQELLNISNLSVRLPESGERTFAIEDVSLSLSRNEILCVVGESGSGKSIMAKTVMGLLPKRLTVFAMIDSDRIRTRLPRSRRSQYHELGLHDRSWAKLPANGMVVVRHSGRRDPANGS